MSGIGDALTVGILLTLIFGAVCFYLYSRLGQNEKRTSLLENLFLRLKISTEASLAGPDSVEAVSAPAPLEPSDIDAVEETEYSELLKDIPGPAPVATAPSAPAASQSSEDTEAAAMEILQSLESAPASVKPSVEANYESMTLRELQTLARQKGITGVAQRKKDIIDALKKQGVAPPVAHIPLTQQEGELDGNGVEPKEGYQISLDA